MGLEMQIVAHEVKIIIVVGCNPKFQGWDVREMHS